MGRADFRFIPLFIDPVKVTHTLILFGPLLLASLPVCVLLNLLLGTSLCGEKFPSNLPHVV